MNVVVSYWSANVVALAAYVVVAATHLLGTRGAAARGQSRPPSQVATAVAFHIGLLLALLAVVSPLGYWSYRFVWARNMQDVVLAIAAPALIVLGAPWRPLRRGMGLTERWPDRRAAGSPGGDEAAGQDRARGWRPLPVLVTTAFCVTWWVWHLPGPFDAAVHSSALYALEVITYLAAGILLWLQLVTSPPLRPPLAPLRRVALLLATAASSTILGLIRVYSPGLVYPAYLGFRHHVLSVVADQQVGGAILWVIPLVPFSIVAVALTIGWLNDDESGAAAAGIDQLLLKHQSAWPSRPGLR